jgi:hypothetical protein
METLKMKLLKMKPGDIVYWLDQGPALILAACRIPAPCLEEDLGEFIAAPEEWPLDDGWKIKLLNTGEILEVHPETIGDDEGATWN